MSVKKEYGDFQTPLDLATRVVSLVGRLYGVPDCVVEPTAGKGAFLHAALKLWGSQSLYEGYEINQDYVEQALANLQESGAQVFCRDFFSEDWSAILSGKVHRRVLALGNPPWVTNSGLAQLGSTNLPVKTNFQGLRGLDALTGKSNFDIAEWILIRLLEALPKGGACAMLCKTATARKVLRHFWKKQRGFADAKLFRFDAKAEFGVAVDACLFYVSGQHTDTCIADVYESLDLDARRSRFGLIDGELVSDCETYQRFRHLDGGCTFYTWRSGVKHDASPVMEFTKEGGKLINGYGELVDIEEDFVYPLLKSSDLGNGRVFTTKAVLIPQQFTGQDTATIERKAPKTWSYLNRHGAALDARKSSIYKKRPRFSIFGVGAYTFSPWKVAVSGFYKNLTFLPVPPLGGKPIVLDDTCYALSCHSQEEAAFLCELLSSAPARAFLGSLIFTDAKRQITIDILKRISFAELAKSLGKLETLASFIYQPHPEVMVEPQLALLMEGE